MIGEDGDDLCRNANGSSPARWPVCCTAMVYRWRTMLSASPAVRPFWYGPGSPSHLPARPRGCPLPYAIVAGPPLSVGYVTPRPRWSRVWRWCGKTPPYGCRSDAPRLPWEPLILRCHADKGRLRLAMGAEAAAYAGHRVELAVSAAERADWLSDQDAALMAGMSLGQWRRWIQTHREVRVGRPIARGGHMAKKPPTNSHGRSPPSTPVIPYQG